MRRRTSQANRIYSYPSDRTSKKRSFLEEEVAVKWTVVLGRRQKEESLRGENELETTTNPGLLEQPGKAGHRKRKRI